MLSTFTAHDWVQAIVVLLITCTVMANVLLHGSIPTDLAPAWAFVVGAYVGGQIAQRASSQGAQQALVVPGTTVVRAP